MKNNKYLLLDSGNEQKLEQVGPFVLIRPCSQAIWKPSLPESAWEEADAIFSRENNKKWVFKKKLPHFWKVEDNNLLFKIMLTDFGHIGIFPEHFSLFDFIEKKLKEKAFSNVLNLFAYTGAVSFASAKAGAKVCHVDASPKAISWARENAALNKLEKAPIRYIVDDALKFIKREIRRKVKYDAIILDPPSFGRGSSGQIFKIENDLYPILECCVDLLSDNPLFIALTCHTPGITETVLNNLLDQVMRKKGKYMGKYHQGEMFLKGADKGFLVPSGSYLIWEFGK